MARPSNKDERREQIAEALLAVMARQGYEGASVAAVARQARVAVGLAHYHFRDKREILLLALERLGQRQEARVTARVEAAGDDPRAQLDAWLEAHLGVASAAPVDLACWVMAGGEALRDPEVRRVHASVVVASVDGLTRIVRRGIAAGVFQATKPEARAIAVALGALVQGYFTVASVAPELPPAGSALKAARAMAGGLLGMERETAAARPRARAKKEGRR